MSRYLNPRSDLVFKKIFGEHAHLLVSFLNSLLPLPPDGLIKSLTYLPSEQVPHIPVLKRTIVDVKCTDQNGQIFIVEMQVEWSAFFMERMLFGASQAYVKQLNKGEDYEYLKPVYGLGLLASNFDHESPEFYHHYKIVNVKKPSFELKGLQFVFIELKKFKPNNHEQKKLQVLWLRFMSEINEETRHVDPDLLAVPEIREAIELSEEAAYTKGELEAYSTYWDAVSTEKTLWSERHKQGKAEGLIEGEKAGIEKGKAEGEKVGIEKGKAEGEKVGIEKGKAEGEKEEKRKIARKMVEQGLQVQVIAMVTGLSENEIKTF